MTEGGQQEPGVSPLDAQKLPGAANAELLARKLEEALGRLRLLSAHTAGIIFELDSSARFVRVWSSDPRLLARPESELLGRTLIEALGPELGGWHDQQVRRTLETGALEDYEYVMDVPGGRRNFAARSVAVPAPEGTGLSAIFWIRDITEQVQTRVRLLQAERLASIGSLAAGVAHEINNPLGYMLLNIGHLQAGLKSLAARQLATDQGELDGLRASVNMMREGTERVRKIVEDLLNFARPGDTLESVDLHRVLNFAMHLTLVELQTRAHAIREFGPVPRVTANENRLVQVFANLLANAAQAIPRGEPADRHAVRLITRTDDRGWAVVEVHDTGCGIPDPLLERIFDPFFTTKEQGSGLGLSICHRIVTQAGGQIQVESEEGKGSLFRVSLPPVGPARQRID